MEPPLFLFIQKGRVWGWVNTNIIRVGPSCQFCFLSIVAVCVVSVIEKVHLIGFSRVFETGPSSPRVLNNECFVVPIRFLERY